jgi:hypothetical protein
MLIRKFVESYSATFLFMIIPEIKNREPENSSLELKPAWKKHYQITTSKFVIDLN